MWRHESWKNPHNKSSSHNFGLGKQEVYGWEHRVFEAGADAMLNAVNEKLAPLDMSFEENGLYVPTRNPEGGN